jgi:C-terminal processing protease CtpA/Prc
MRLIKYGFAIVAAFVVASCSGGGTTTPVVTNPPPVSTGPTWANGVFEAASTFKNKCVAPRAGTTDTSGSVLEENHWLRSWSNETYLWYNEITDIDPGTVNVATDYFDLLKTNATTASGNPRDQFHFWRDTAEYQELISSGTSAGYGASFALISASVPREIKISYVEAGAPASSSPANLMRGTEILQIDGANVIDGSADILNAGLFPADAGETHTFTVQDVGAAGTRTFDMISQTVTTLPVNVATTLDTPSGKIGYLHFTTFGTQSAEEAVIDAMTDFSTAGVDELVLDLRYNGGGFLDIAAELGYMIAGSTQTTGKDFDNLVFNDKNPTTNPVTGDPLTPTPFHSTAQGFSVAAGQALPALNFNRVFILSTSRTCSASEAVINGLRGADVEVVLIGTTTCGKPYGFYATDNCSNTYFTIQFRGENDKGFGDYADGFSPMNATANVAEAIPGCEIGDDFTQTLGNQAEAQFAAALTYIDTGACPVGTTKTGTFAKAFKGQVAPEDVTSLYNDERLRTRFFLEQNLIVTGPEGEK